MPSYGSAGLNKNSRFYYAQFGQFRNTLPWAIETFAISKADASGLPPFEGARSSSTPNTSIRPTLMSGFSPGRAGIPLAYVLNKQLGVADIEWKACLATH